MIAKLRSFGAAAAALLFIASVSAANVGEPAPQFSLTDIDGKTHSLSDYAGKVVVLEWTNYGCPIVKKHYNSGNMQSLQDLAKGKDVVWLSICSSAPGTQGHMSAAEWKAAIAEKGVKSSAVLIDESGKVGHLYSAKVTPHMYVIDSKGTLVYDGAIDSIPSGKIADIEKADNYVIAALDAVLAGKPIETSKVKPYGCGIKYAR
ncbi:thioredoxin family protein [Pelagicoccus sp. SDUM812005]|uniref:thioredoxin family protein n=1 Tax=Pelagicoccus sp. SDUM812005 TaxID=3041257 RepID=UPI00280F3A38|nr:thioredoxin family protein [Pelagicoccus sp. SDUM812005]MDQ8181725.1 thioredoxin family protein [Pelagicoccus sp. SDUM812005]